MSETTTKEPRYTFRLKSGSHYDGKTGRAYEPGDLVASDTDLQAEARALDPSSKRWERVGEFGEESIEDLKARLKILEGMLEKPESTSTAVDSDDLDKMSIAKLRALAQEMEVDLTDCSNKAEIISVLREALDTN